MRTLTFNRILGTGAMGTVYHAELRVPQGFARQCAVKVLKTTADDQSHFRTRMRDEARLLGMLQDEQVLGVSELVVVEGKDCLVMEYVEGVDLSEIIAQQTVPPKVLAELGAEIAGTLYRAHNAKHPNTGDSLEVIHRDVKPANVMVTSRGGVRLLDFGVARAAFASRESQTQGLVLGTLNYFPPEILAGAEPTRAVDIYGLGLTMWECAAAKDWGSPQVHRKRFERRVEQRLAEIEDDYRPIIAILGRVLAWDPQMRPSGGLVERELLVAAESCKGEGLRTWARAVVPPLLQAKTRLAPVDDWVGKTLKIDSGDGNGSQRRPLEPIHVSSTRHDVNAEVTFNDLAPPSAVRRPATDDRADVSSVQPPKRLPPVTPDKSGGMGRIVMIMVAAIVVGGGVGIMVVVALLFGLFVFQSL